jgi:hypothetical protein
MSLGPNKKPSMPLRSLRELAPRVRLRLALAGGVVLFAIAALATCGGCGKREPAGGDTTAAKQAGGDGSAPIRGVEPDAATLRDMRKWESAKDGEEEDLATLAVHEGAVGLVEAASDPALRPTAIRAMGYARGWAQLPFLAKTASAQNDDEARLALDAAVELATRPRRAEDPEDSDELREGCDGLMALARGTSRPRPRRVSAIRALRMMPCPPPTDGKALPSDVDSK